MKNGRCVHRCAELNAPKEVQTLPTLSEISVLEIRYVRTFFIKEKKMK